jgi:Outer membrane protein beta-barrel domain
MKQTILCAACLAAIFLFLYNTPAFSQTETRKFEVGAQFSMIRFNDLEITEPGVGGRFAYNVNSHLGIEAEANFFLREVKDSFGDILQGGRKTQGLFGIKLGARNERLGVFGKVRPGFVHFSHFERNGIVCTNACPPQPPPTFSETDFALDLGGVFELYPSRRTLVRFDLGDTIVHSGSGENILLPDTFVLANGTSFPTVKGVVRSTSHNLQFSVGFGFRF